MRGSSGLVGVMVPEGQNVPDSGLQCERWEGLSKSLLQRLQDGDGNGDRKAPPRR